MTPMFTIMDMHILADMTMPGILCFIILCFVARYFPRLEQHVQEKIIAWITGPLLNMVLVIGFAIAFGLAFQILT